MDARRGEVSPGEEDGLGIVVTGAQEPGKPEDAFED